MAQEARLLHVVSTGANPTGSLTPSHRSDPDRAAILRTARWQVDQLNDRASIGRDISLTMSPGSALAMERPHFGEVNIRATSRANPQFRYLVLVEPSLRRHPDAVELFHSLRPVEPVVLNTIVRPKTGDGPAAETVQGYWLPSTKEGGKLQFSAAGVYLVFAVEMGPDGPAVWAGKPFVVRPHALNEFEKGVVRGTYSTMALFASGISAVAQGVGADQLKTLTNEISESFQAQAARYPPQVQTFESALEGIGPFLSYFSAAIGEQVPTLTAMIIGGGVGRIFFGSGARLATLLRSRGLTPQQAAAKANEAATRWRYYGAGLGAFGTNAELQTGGIYQGLMEIQGLDDSQAAVLAALTGGVVGGFLETLVPFSIARMWGLGGKLAVGVAKHIAAKPTLAKRVLGTVAATTAGEGLTEGLQEEIAIAAESAFLKPEVRDYFGPENNLRRTEATAKGSLVGLAMHGSAGAAAHAKTYASRRAQPGALQGLTTQPVGTPAHRPGETAARPTQAMYNGGQITRYAAGVITFADKFSAAAQEVLAFHNGEPLTIVSLDPGVGSAAGTGTFQADAPDQTKAIPLDDVWFALPFAGGAWSPDERVNRDEAHGAPETRTPPDWNKLFQGETPHPGELWTFKSLSGKYYHAKFESFVNGAIKIQAALAEPSEFKNPMLNPARLVSARRGWSHPRLHDYGPRELVTLVTGGGTRRTGVIRGYADDGESLFFETMNSVTSVPIYSLQLDETSRPSEQTTMEVPAGIQAVTTIRAWDGITPEIGQGWTFESISRQYYYGIFKGNTQTGVLLEDPMTHTTTMLDFDRLISGRKGHSVPELHAYGPGDLIRLVSKRDNVRIGVIQGYDANGMVLFFTAEYTRDGNTTQINRVEPLKPAELKLHRTELANAGSDDDVRPLGSRPEQGLRDSAMVSQFAKVAGEFQRDWDTLDVRQRAGLLGDAINQHISQLGIPRLDIMVKDLTGRTQGSFSPFSWTITINEQILKFDGLNAKDFQSIASTFYHEARHAEQWFLIARYHASLGRSETEIAVQLRVPGRVASRAVADGQPSDQQKIEAQKYYQSFYGLGEKHRNDVFSSDSTAAYWAYRDLPEEVDAFAADDQLSREMERQNKGLLTMLGRWFGWN